MNKHGKASRDEFSYNPVFHNTWKLLSKFRDVVWSLETSVQQVRNRFCIDYGSSIEEFLDSIYMAGAELAGSDIEFHARSIERSNKMLQLVRSSVEILREKHKCGEIYYWILYYTYLSPQEYQSIGEIIDQLRPHIRESSFRTYYRRRREAVEALSSVLWGYTAQDSIEILDKFFPDTDLAENWHRKE